MGSKHAPRAPDLDSDPYEDFEDELDDDLGNIKERSKGFYSADWEDPSESDYRFNTRRKIERRKELRDLYTELDDGCDLDFNNEW